MAKLSINMIVYSDKETKYIPYLFDSLSRQSFQDYEMIVIDNASDGEVIKVVEEELKKLQKPYRILKQDTNVGFAQGHNIAYKAAQSEYVLLLNPDMYLMSETIERMIAFLDKHHQTSAVATRLMRWDFDVVQSAEGDVPGKAQRGFTSDIDAIGIRLLRNRRAIEWLTRQTWAKDSDSKEVREMFDKKIIEVFGVSGAFAMFRKELIDKLLLPGDNLFDQTYHSYKEDLDLAYRMRNAGYTSYVILDSVAYHDRTGAAPKSMSDAAAIRNKTKQSRYVRYHSYKNHIRTLYKNEYWQNLLLDFPFIFWFEIKKFGYLLVTEPGLLFGCWKEIFVHGKELRAARASIKTTRKMYWKGLRRWF